MPRAAPPPARSTAAWWRERRAGTGLRRPRILARSAGSAGRRALRTADTARRRQGDSCRLALRARPERNGAGGQQCAGREQRAGQAASGAQDVADADERDDLSDREGGRQRADEAACRRTAHDARLLEADPERPEQAAQARPGELTSRRRAWRQLVYHPPPNTGQMGPVTASASAASAAHAWADEACARIRTRHTSPAPAIPTP